MFKINDNNKWFDFLEGCSDVTKIEAIISREKTPNGGEMIHVSVGNHEIYSFWNVKQKNPTPKHTGGKKPYICLMVDKIEELRNSNIDGVEEMIGFLTCLGKNIEWHTGRLVKKRSKKQLQYVDLQSMFSFGKRKLDRILRDLQANGLLSNTTEGYFICKDLIKKGK